MREFLYLIIIVVAILIFLSIVRKVKRDIFIIFWVGVIIAVCSVCVLKFVNVNTLPEEVYSVVENVKEEVGNIDIVRVNSNDEIELLINEEWVNVSEIDIVSSFTDKITIEYEGTEIEIMDSGIVSAIKVLEKLNFIK